MGIIYGMVIMLSIMIVSCTYVGNVIVGISLLFTFTIYDDSVVLL